VTQLSPLARYASSAPPDNTSSFYIEPNWGTQTTSGTVTFANVPFTGAIGMNIDDVYIAAGQIATNGKVHNLIATRADWSAWHPLDGYPDLGEQDGTLVMLPCAGCQPRQGALVAWAFARDNALYYVTNNFKVYSGIAQDNKGNVPIVWSQSDYGGFPSYDTWIGGRSDPHAGSNHSRGAILEFGGVLGRATPTGTDQAGTDTVIQGGLSTGAGIPGNTCVWEATAGSSGTTINTGSSVGCFTPTGLQGAIGQTTPAAGAFSSINDSGLTASLAVCTDGSKNLTTSGCSSSGVDIQSIGVDNSSQSLLNFIASTVNASGLTATPSNPAGGTEKVEITGTVNATKGGTGADTHTSTGIAQVSSGTWSISTTLANGTTATTQSPADNSTKVATTAYADALGALKLNIASPTPTGTFNGSGLTQQSLPVHTSFATLANGEVGYDSTNKNWHLWQNGADVILAPLAAGFVSGNCGAPTATSSTWQIADSGNPCGTSSMVYPAAGVAVSTSSAWTTPLAVPVNSLTQLTATVFHGTAVMPTAAIASATNSSIVIVSASGVLTTDIVRAGFNGNPTGIVGFVPSTNGTLSVYCWPTAGNINCMYQNNTAAWITPDAVTLNVEVTR
jgi:hypothetical protein